jgi:sulfoxide reductase heme-binding subunit YedZ
MQRQLGKAWKKLHRWVYVAGVLAIIHYIWVVKLPFGTPTLYAIILALLLVARIPPVRTWLGGLRPKPATKPTARKVPKVATET